MIRAERKTISVRFRLDPIQGGLNRLFELAVQFDDRTIEDRFQMFESVILIDFRERGRLCEQLDRKSVV